ncbi:hypothetical protein [Amycolatopsis sp. NPDC051371]|uniref:hypothetical protein n=1 Tax=Amycolatopsis sp. NPDC051371 TaxID=3155800 RepID=UPI0034409785
MVLLRTSAGLSVDTPDESNIRAVLEALPRGGHVILEHEKSASGSEHYIQAWLRPEGTYQLEYREGNADNHYQTLTISREKVGDALIGWLDAESTWRESFQWKSIGDWLAGK